MSTHKKPKKPFKLPPQAFANCMNRLTNAQRKRWKPHDFSDWEESQEWRIFNAGIMEAYRMMSSHIHSETQAILDSRIL
jgi:hypothetical protein